MKNETLRKKFFEEFTDKIGGIEKITLMPNDVFEWIEDNCLNKKIKCTKCEDTGWFKDSKEDYYHYKCDCKTITP